MLKFPKEFTVKRQNWRSSRPGMSASHLKRVRRLPCCVCCRSHPSEAHHLKQTGAGERGMGLKSTDRFAIPICTLHHNQVEAIGSKNEIAWFEERGVDALALANDLWAKTILGNEELEAAFSEHTRFNLARMS